MNYQTPPNRCVMCGDEVNDPHSDICDKCFREFIKSQEREANWREEMRKDYCGDEK